MSVYLTGAAAPDLFFDFDADTVFVALLTVFALLEAGVVADLAAIVVRFVARDVFFVGAVLVAPEADDEVALLLDAGAAFGLTEVLDF